MPENHFLAAIAATNRRHAREMAQPSAQAKEINNTIAALEVQLAQK